MPSVSEPAGEPRRRRIDAELLAIFLLALGIRILHGMQLRAAPFFALKMGDSLSYDLWARRIAGGDWLGGEVFYQAPLYPYFLGALYRWLSDDIGVVRLVQAGLGAMSCVFLAAAARSFVSRRAGLLAGVILACYAPAIFFDSLIQKSVLDLFFLTLLLALLGKFQESGGAGRLLAAGTALGALVLVRENALVFVPGLIGWRLVASRGRRDALRTIGVLLAGLLLVLLPVAARNQWVGGEFHLTTAQFGPNFYIGNHAHATGEYQPLRPGRGDARFEREDATDLAERAEGRSLTPAEVSAYWTRRTLDDIAAEPMRWSLLLLRKLFLALNATESIDTEDLATYAEWSLPLRVLGKVTHFGVLVPLALLGIGASVRHRRRLGVLLVMASLYLASTLLFFVFARYRYPLVPILILFAAAGILALPRLVRDRPRRELSVCALLVLASAIGCNLPGRPVDEMRATTQYNIAGALVREGRAEEAVAYYTRALELRRVFPEVHFHLGKLLLSQGHGADAARHLRAAIQLRPDYEDVYPVLGIAQQTLGRLPEAAESYRHALKSQPDNPRIHKNLASVLLALGSLAEAAEHGRRAVLLADHDADAHAILGSILLGQGHRDAAIEQFEAGLRVQPDHALLQNNLAAARKQAGPER